MLVCPQFWPRVYINAFVE